MKQPERWTYGGVRYSSKGRRHAWIDQDFAMVALLPKLGEEHIYADIGTFVIGGIYDVEVDRSTPELVRSAPQYTGDRVASSDIRVALELRDTEGRTRLAKKALEKKHANDRALSAAFEPLAELVSQCRTSADRDALAAIAKCGPFTEATDEL